MARTVKIAKYIQIPGPTNPLRLPSRRVSPKPAGLYLLQLRAHAQMQASPRRLQIIITANNNSDAQSVPVKITLT